MRRFPLSASYALVAMTLCVPPVPGTQATEGTQYAADTTLVVRPEKNLEFDWAKIQARARIIYVSSGRKPLACHAIDGDRSTTFRFLNSDLHPTVIVELAQDQKLHRVSVVYKMGEGRVDIYLLTGLARDPGDLRDAKPLTSIIDRAEDGSQAAANFEPSNARYVALRWTRNESGKEPLDIAEISAFSDIPPEQFPAGFAEGTTNLPGESGIDFSNKLGTLADPPVIASVSP